MYSTFFEFTEKPFTITPDPRFFFMSRRHKEALAHLLYGMSESGGFVQLTGEVGTGKTTLCRCLVEQAPDEVDVALILNPKQTAVELVLSICEELHVQLPSETDSLKVLIDILNQFLLTSHKEGRRTVLIIDEAQNLSAEVLEQVRLLTNLETNKQKLLQILLIGQPELQTLLSRPDLRQLAQRITARYHLSSLSRDETIAYIMHRLEVAGPRKNIFNRNAMRLVHKFSNGIPRLVNIICDRALLGAYGKQVEHVDGKLVRKAYREVMGQVSGVRGRNFALWGTALMLMLLILGTGWQLSPWSTSVDFEKLKDWIGKPKFNPGGGIDEKIVKLDYPKPKVIAEEIADSNAKQNEIHDAIPGSKVKPGGISKKEEGQVRVFDEIVAGKLGKTDTETAIRTLFKLWSKSYSVLEGANGCKRALSAGLRCFQGKGNWSKLRQLNRPAILELINDGRQYHVPLVDMTEMEVTLALPDQDIVLGRKEIEPYWFGDFLLLWKPPVLRNNLLAKGIIGSDVLWLRRQLDNLGGSFSGSDTEGLNQVFDDDLERRVMAFQRSRALDIDGIVGEETLVHMASSSEDPSVPVLYKTDNQ